LKFLNSKVFFISFFLIIIIFLNFCFFNKILHLSYVPINLFNQTIGIYQNYPKTWNLLKNIYNIFFISSNVIILEYIYEFLKPHLSIISHINNTYIEPSSTTNLELFLGYNIENNHKVFIPKKGLYQNLLVTGSIGSRKNQQRNVSLYRANTKI